MTSSSYGPYHYVVLHLVLSIGQRESTWPKDSMDGQVKDSHHGGFSRTLCGGQQTPQEAIDHSMGNTSESII